MFIDITDMLLPSLSNKELEQTVTEAKQGMVPSRHPQAWHMFAKLAAHQTHSIDKDRDEHYDFDHAMNFRALVTCLTEFVDPSAEISFEEPREPDEAVRRLFAAQLMNETNLHQAACMRNGLRRAWYDPENDCGELRLGKRRRRSAISLIDPLAQLDLLSALRKMDTSLKLNLENDEVYFAFASADEHLRYARDADPGAWARFEAATGITANLLTSMSGFLIFLEVSANTARHSLVYTAELLDELGGIYKMAFPDSLIDGSNAASTVQVFSLTPHESKELLLPVPFFGIGDRFLRYPGFSHILSPAIGLLTILIRRYEKAWNDSVGSTLARAADVIATTLPTFDHLLVAARRKLAKGDIDLALYDVRTHHLLICEVKTVYDKHKTVLHMHQFEDKKVKIDHAVKQLREAAELITQNPDMHGLFHKKLPPPLQISKILLTWFDPVDLTVGTIDEDILSLNFATFRYLLSVAEGDIDDFVRMTRELRNVWCIAEKRPIDLQVAFEQTIEVQLPIIDATDELEEIGFSDLTRAELAKMPALESGWRNSPASQVVSFLRETKEVLENYVTQAG